MGSDVKRGDVVSVPCRGCGRSFHKVKVAEGAQPMKCASCGRVTRIRVRCTAEACRVFTEPVPRRNPGSD